MFGVWSLKNVVYTVEIWYIDNLIVMSVINIGLITLVGKKRTYHMNDLIQ